MIPEGWTAAHEWASDGLRPLDDLCTIRVMGYYGDISGPVLAGMLSVDAFHGGSFHRSCDIIAYQEVKQ